jgi:hypothetical protein
MSGIAEIKRILFCLLILAVSRCFAGRQLDKTRYIGIDEIKPGMKAYCLTTYKGTEAEKFELEVLDVVRNIAPGKNAILVQGTDERFIHSGPVAGCSGSPVYINGRLAGALAFGWVFSKDPLYGVTPIEEMLMVAETAKQGNSERGKLQNDDLSGFSFDFSRPIDFAEVGRKLADRKNQSAAYSASGIVPLSCPLVTCGLPDSVCEQLDELVRPLGFMAVAGGNSKPAVDKSNLPKARLVPGASLVVPLMMGDISMEAVGTVTEVDGDKVYGFGHSFLGYGEVNLPMATGQVHTVVSSVFRSFKLASSLEVVGAVTTDQSTAILGRLGAKAKMIPLTIKVERYNDPQKRTYNCQVVNNRLFTPIVLGSAIHGAAYMLGGLPPDNTIAYKAVINIENAEPIVFENTSTVTGLSEAIMETVGSVAILMNNPYGKVDIKSMDFEVRLDSKNTASHIWSVDLSASTVKAGRKLDVFMTIESAFGKKKKYQFEIEIPPKLPAGEYNLIVCGGSEYQKFLLQKVPYRFIPENVPTLIEVINNILQVRRNRLYCLLELPDSGIAVEKAELPGLPAVKAMVLQDAKRSLATQPCENWIEKVQEIETIVSDKKIVRITVEE